MVFKLDLKAAGLKKPTIPLSIIPTIPQIPATVPVPAPVVHVPSATVPSNRIHNGPSCHASLQLDSKLLVFAHLFACFASLGYRL